MNTKIYKNFILFTLLSFFTLTVYSQKAKDIRYTVGIKELGYDNAAFEQYAAQITENVATNLKSTNRANVVLAKSSGAVEDNLAESIDAANMDTWVTQKKGKMKYTIHGSINSIKFIKMGIKGYKSIVSFTVRVIDNVTEDVVAQQEFKSSDSPVEIAKTAAFPSALKTTNKSQLDFFKSFFNLRATILKIDDASKTSAKTLTITAGKTSGLTKKDQFIVKQVEMLDGFLIENEIGILKVKEIGNTTTKCQVSKGGKDILSLFDKANRESLICELKVKK
tara:strand:+ start:1417 stop:2253 length:837 start_codon:yes stop_codon:yes gene_type:complete